MAVIIGEFHGSCDATAEGDKVPITVTASEAKNRLGSLLEYVQCNQDDVIVESHGRPKAAIIPYPEYENLIVQREQIRRLEALSRLDQLRQQVQARNQDLTEDQASALADRFTREAVKELVEEDRIRYRG